jgi:hypothetical protein
MSELDKAVETQIKNIQAKTGKSFDELAAIVRSSGLSKHGEIRAMLSATWGWATATPIRWSMPCCNRTGRARRQPAR